ncbi:rhodanese-like domain-containing protein [Myceligenerans salitolerans]|uniref:Rhodanese-like domain-containing protein n=1 Tax=Myceligenerans salitolerans TaxID=1230528 RepID=A0ABS3I9I1_9MICO|nr:rhodanese-like domain-containing protein [Myceligenerans salitolerans]MBO0609686.1 rhodanese-like domain-containing protein [Myceligenerans salitolerans]
MSNPEPDATAEPAHRVEARPAAGYAGDITPQQAWDLLDGDPDATLVDVRTEGEWRTIGVPDVRSLGKQVVFAEWVHADGRPNPAFLEELKTGVGATDGPVVFLCRSGQRSIGAARLATSAGIAPSYNVVEGFEGPAGPDGVRNHSGWKVRDLPWTEAGA